MPKVIVALSLVCLLGACAERVLPSGNSSTYSESAALSDFDARINFWTARLPRDPEDSTAAEQLAAAYLGKARGSGDFSYYIKTDQLLSPIAKREPENYQVLTLLASAKAAQHKFKEAELLAERARKLKPEEPTPYALLFDTRMEQGDLGAAEQALIELTSREPGFAALTRSAQLRIERGDFPGALLDLEAALELAEAGQVPSEDRAWLHVRMGALFFDRARYREAEQHYQAALEISPESYLVLEHVAELHAARAEYQEALALYEKVIAKAPHAEFFLAVAEVYTAQGRQPEALPWLERAETSALAKLNAGDTGYYRFLSDFYADHKLNPELAVRYAKLDLDLRQDAHSFETYAWALYRAGDFEAARQAIEKTLAFGSDDPKVHLRAAAIFRASGDDLSAERHSIKAKALNPVG